MGGDASGLKVPVNEGEECALSVEERSAVWRYSFHISVKSDSHGNQLGDWLESIREDEGTA